MSDLSNACSKDLMERITSSVKAIEGIDSATEGETLAVTKVQVGKDDGAAVSATSRAPGRRRKVLPPVPVLGLPTTAPTASSSSPAERPTAENVTAEPGDSGSDLQDAGGTIARFTALEPSATDLEQLALEIGQALVPDGGEVGAKPGASWSAPLASGEAVAGRIGELSTGRPGFAEEVGDGGGGGAADDAPGRDGLPPSPPPPTTSAAAGEAETLSDIDDEELEAYLLDEEETRNKSDIWHEVNKDYLEEWHVRGQESRHKRQRQSEAQETGSESGSKCSSSRGRRFRYPSASSCTQSAMMALAKRAKVGPNRINIEALDALFS